MHTNSSCICQHFHSQKSHGSEWPTKLCADTQGKEFIVSLTETIWYIDMHDHKKLEERNYHIPKLFLEFFGHTNPESYKQSRKPFDANELNLHCQALAPYEPVDIEEYLLTDPMQRMRYIQGLSHAFTYEIGEYRFNSGNNAFNAILIWKIDKQATEIKILQENKRIAKSSSLRTIYKMLTGDISAAETANEARVNEHVKMFLEFEDLNITIDLREHNSGNLI
ncbi:hypothetical protein RhiirC2_708088 [Rhizophagus irregularis]|uniref:Uncharacterized protein n=1 Tax=Rhizophagus irregularis TaxID=588596 RepID=A0A2N1NNM2_9GLOM|nr:hypothetical protein RhiirC2_708088 [Rhizophagus irregularis]